MLFFILFAVVPSSAGVTNKNSSSSIATPHNMVCRSLEIMNIFPYHLFRNFFSIYPHIPLNIIFLISPDVMRCLSTHLYRFAIRKIAQTHQYSRTDIFIIFFYRWIVFSIISSTRSPYYDFFKVLFYCFNFYTMSNILGC